MIHAAYIRMCVQLLVFFFLLMLIMDLYLMYEGSVCCSTGNPSAPVVDV